jgi:hypothetical protein
MTTPPFQYNRISVKPELRSKNGFSSLIRGAGTLGSCPAEPKNIRNDFVSNLEGRPKERPLFWDTARVVADCGS